MVEQPDPKEQRVCSVLVPFAASKGTPIVKNLNKTFTILLPNNEKTRSAYSSQN